MKKDVKYLRILKTLGKNIKTQRQKKNLTLEELSLKTGIRQTYLIKMEKGQAFRITTGHIFIISQALEIRPYDLVYNIK